MFLNINGTVQKNLRNVGGKNYKVANQALYGPQIANEAIYKLEVYRKLKLRLRLTVGDRVMSGYIRHVEIEGGALSDAVLLQKQQAGQTT